MVGAPSTVQMCDPVQTLFISLIEVFYFEAAVGSYEVEITTAQQKNKVIKTCSSEQYSSYGLWF